MPLAASQPFRKPLFWAALVACSFATVCSSGNAAQPPVNSSSSVTQTHANSSTSGESHRQILADFADKVIIPTYDQFAGHAGALSTALDTLAQDPTPKTLEAARQAWVTARSSWMQGECFAFGPIDSLGYDGQLDTGTINNTDLKNILNDTTELTPEFIEQLQNTHKGFHVIAYLLFGETQDKALETFTFREYEYLQALGKDFSRVATTLANSWKQGVEGQPAYRDVIAKAGEKDNSTYPTVQAGIEEIVNGMADSLDEVANEKLGEPFLEKDPQGLESYFSQNTLADIKNNLQGARNVYLGSVPNAQTSGMGLSAYLAKVNPELDAKLKRQFEVAAAALEEVPGPLETSLTEASAATAIQEAQTALEMLHQMVRTEVLPLVAGL
jgi:putative iron-regulated protein